MTASLTFGRVAIPLRERGVSVTGIELSSASIPSAARACELLSHGSLPPESTLGRSTRFRRAAQSDSGPSDFAAIPLVFAGFVVSCSKPYRLSADDKNRANSDGILRRSHCKTVAPSSTRSSKLILRRRVWIRNNASTINAARSAQANQPPHVWYNGCGTVLYEVFPETFVTLYDSAPM